MNVSLPDQMKAWVEAQADGGRYANSSDYVRDLIRRDQARREKIAAMDEMVAEGLASGVDPRAPDEIMDDIRARYRAMVADAA